MAALTCIPPDSVGRFPFRIHYLLKKKSTFFHDEVHDSFHTTESLLTYDLRINELGKESKSLSLVARQSLLFGLEMPVSRWKISLGISHITFLTLSLASQTLMVFPPASESVPKIIQLFRNAC